MGLNAHLLSLTATYRGAGINGYIYQLLRHLPDADATMDYVAYLYDRSFEAGAGLTVEASRWDTRSPWRRIAWEQTRLAAASRGLDLLHGLAYATPVAAACPTIVSVHDLSFMRFPDAFRRSKRLLPEPADPALRAPGRAGDHRLGEHPAGRDRPLRCAR